MKPLAERQTAFSTPLVPMSARCGVWQLHEPECSPSRELDNGSTQGLPWDHTLVRVRHPFAELAERAIQALESGSEDPRAKRRRTPGCRSLIKLLGVR